MARHCKGCGAELFEAQKFCRACGRPTDELPGENEPTRMMPPISEGWGARSSADTAPSAFPNTNPVTSEPLYYQPPNPGMTHAPMQRPPFVAPRSKSPLIFFLASVGTAVFVMIIVAVIFVAKVSRNRPDGGGRGGSIAATMGQGEQAFTEGTADTVNTSASESILTKQFNLNDDARVSISNINGDVTVTTWDKPQAELRAIRKASDPDRIVPVFFKNDNGNLSIRTGPSRRGGDVKFEIILPREVGRLDLNTTNGSIKLADVTGEMSVKTVNGNLNLSNLEGALQGETVNGLINASLSGLGDKGSSLKTTNGSINLQMKDDINAQLEAESVHGNLSIDESFGVAVEKQFLGQKARGAIGGGGANLVVKTLNGNIKITK
ncbi:MAG TPA: DUF4097 family beta strand repeat-containing protein [Blastocatellia bacterium]|nr:DUF4097 family beta strand repeat-containing protein [Blastocatellia bacterium]